LKRILKICSVICIVMSFLALCVGFLALTSKSYFVGFALFFMLKKGSIISFIGNLIAIIIFVLCYFQCGLNGLLSLRDNKYAKTGFGYSIALIILSLISIICSLVLKVFGFGDIMLLLLPMLYLISLIKTR